MQDISRLMSGRAAPRDRRRVPRRTLFRRSDDGRPSLYGDGLVRLWLDGPAAGGASARAGEPPCPQRRPRRPSGPGRASGAARRHARRPRRRPSGRPRRAPRRAPRSRRRRGPGSPPRRRRPAKLPAGRPGRRPPSGRPRRAPGEAPRRAPSGRAGNRAGAAESDSLAFHPGASLVRVARRSFHPLRSSRENVVAQLIRRCG